ncbi:MAG: PVC-type heme-binding CxxCH protein [Verrucomicrobiota bacterium]|nr:PVC-type heme-binding CxxCH protein [Verrucomicrobiota bacterium]
MTSRWLFATALGAAVAGHAGPNPFAAGVRTTDPLTPAAEQKTFILPAGFKIQLFAAEPQINKPMNMAFDARGRLWVTSTLEYPFPVKPGTKGRDSVKILEDTNGDGRADKVATFADGLNIPTGVYPYKDGVIVWSIPNIWHLRDTDGDGRPDRREKLYGPLGYERDTHGMNSSFTRGLDGWLHATHGFNNHTTVRGSDGTEIRLQSGNTYRVRLDGSSVQQVTWGQVNPFGMCLDPRGNFYTADCHSSPIYQLIPGAYYPSFGKPHDGLGYAPRVILHSHGSTAICGILFYDDNLWPKKYLGNLFVGNVMTSRVNRDTLQFDGSSPNGTEAPDFLKTTDPWFRPVDLQLGPDGALYIADFYNRIIGHYEVPLNHPGRDRTRGRIWRVTYAGKTHPKLDLTTPAKAVAELSSPNLTRRQLALNHLADIHGQRAISALKKQSAHHLSAWALHRLGKLTPAELATLAQSPQPLARLHAMRILGALSQWKPAQRELVMQGLVAADPHVKRAAVEALALHPAAAHVKPLAEATEKFLLFDSLQVKGSREADDHLIHTLRISLRNQLRAPGAFAGIPNLPANLNRDLITRAALGVATPEAGDFLIRQLPRLKGDPTPVIRHAARYAADLDPLAPFIEKQFASNLLEQARLFNAMLDSARERGRPLSKAIRAWAGRLAINLLRPVTSADSARRLTDGAQIARDLQLATAADPLRKMAADSSVDTNARAAAVDALGRILQPSAFAAVVKPILGSHTTPASLREAVVITAAALPPLQSQLTEALATAPAGQQLKFARALAAAKPGADTLLKTIALGRAPATLLLDQRVKEQLPAALRSQAIKLAANVELPNANVAKIIAARLKDFRAKGGDTKRGSEVFKLACAACHQRDGEGGNIGPQLDGIGSRGAERVIEDVLDPNRNVDLAFRYSIIKLKNNQTLLGLKRREAGQAIVFADLAGKETTIPKADIAKQTPTTRSLMPDNLAAALSPADFNALLAYLLMEK